MPIPETAYKAKSVLVHYPVPQVSLDHKFKIKIFTFKFNNCFIADVFNNLYVYIVDRSRSSKFRVAGLYAI